MTPLGRALAAGVKEFGALVRRRARESLAAARRMASEAEAEAARHGNAARQALKGREGRR